MAVHAARAARQVAKRHGLLAAGVAGWLLGCLATLLAWNHAEAQRQAAAVKAFGSAVAEDVAYLAVEPLMRQDRIGLGLLANRLAERPQVRGIAVHTLDKRPFVVVGEASRRSSPTFAASITVEDSVVGSARVTVNAAAFELSLGSLLFDSWWYWLGGLLLAAGGGLLADRRWRSDAPASAAAPLIRNEVPPAAASPAEAMANQPAGVPPNTADALVLVANLFSRAKLAAAERDAALRRCLAAARTVAHRHGGNTELLDRVGVAVTFAGAGPDAADDALHGALLLRAAMARTDAAPLFRYGLDRLASTVSAPADAVALMAALAADGELLLGAAAFASLKQPERLRATPIDEPAWCQLSPTAQPSHTVQGVAADQEAELAAQAAAIAAALG